MLLLISDVNILIDMEAGDLMDAFFQLPMQPKERMVPEKLYMSRLV